MTAYLISLCRHVTDRQRLEDYWANVAAAFKGVIAKPLGAYTPFEVLEGDSGVLGVVLFEFSSMEEARRWYNSAAYQKSEKTPRRGSRLRSHCRGRRGCVGCSRADAGVRKLENNTEEEVPAATALMAQLRRLAKVSFELNHKARS
jgi:uncharacterized protein (DUF1330 family)